MLAAALPSGAESARYDFRGSRLGMTLEEWKAVHPPEQLHRAAKPLCSTDTPDARWAVQTPESKAAGIVLCVYIDTEGYPGPVGQRFGPSEITGAEYLFFDGRLYMIDILAVDLALPAFREALQAKYGPPTDAAQGVTRNRLGTPFPEITEAWESGRDVIALRSPATRIDRFSVTIFDKAAAAKADAARKAAQGANNSL